MTLQGLKRRIRALIPFWRSPALEERIDASVSALSTDLRTIASRLKRAEETSRQIRDEQKALRVMFQGLARQKPDAASAELDLGSELVPLHGDAIEGPDSGSIGELDLNVTMTKIDACPVCGTAERTLVCEYNRLILLDVEVDEGLKRYDYCLCHGCGITYASRRPAGETFRQLFDQFDDNLGRSARNQTRRSLLLSPGKLSEKDRATITSRLSAGTLVSEHLETPPNQFFPQVQADRLALSLHVEILSAHLKLHQPRVLEIRPRFGSILAALVRLYDAQPFALPMTDAQRLVMEQAYGITASELLNFENFRIPYDGQFDLIIANHMLTHALKPGDFLREAHRRLAPGGHLYLYHEPDDAEFVTGPASMINTLNPFHVQTFDRRSLTRGLAACGFEPVFVAHEKRGMLCLARPAQQPPSPRIPKAEFTERESAYLKARDLAILRVPESQRWRFRDEWDAIVTRAVASGVAGFDDQARLHPARPPAPAETPDDMES